VGDLKRKEKSNHFVQCRGFWSEKNKRIDVGGKKTKESGRNKRAKKKRKKASRTQSGEVNTADAEADFGRKKIRDPTAKEREEKEKKRKGKNGVAFLKGNPQFAEEDVNVQKLQPRGRGKRKKKKMQLELGREDKRKLNKWVSTIPVGLDSQATNQKKDYGKAGSKTEKKKKKEDEKRKRGRKDSEKNTFPRVRWAIRAGMQRKR